MTRIHVNRHRLRAGHAPIGVERPGRRKLYGHAIHISGPSTIVHRPDKPLPCGAKAWIETNAKVRRLRHA